MSTIYRGDKILTERGLGRGVLQQTKTGDRPGGRCTLLMTGLQSEETKKHLREIIALNSTLPALEGKGILFSEVSLDLHLYIFIPYL